MKMGKIEQFLEKMLRGGGPPPVFIGVMGMTGAGKSTFIKKLTGDQDIQIGTRLRSCTKFIQPAYMEYKDADGGKYDVFLVDTPGFDDTEMSDTDVLYRFAEWLQLQAQNQLKLSGLIYLHRITDNRMSGSATRNLNMMLKLVGEANLKNVVLVTSRWEMINLEEAEEREQLDLLGPDGFWYDMVNLGATSARYDGTVTAAHTIIERLIRQSPTYLRIQDELRQGIGLKETAAGQEVIGQLEKDAIKREQELREIKEEMMKANENAQRSALLLEAQQRRYNELIEKMKRDEEARRELLEGDKERLEQRVKDLEEKLKGGQGWGGLYDGIGKLKCIIS
ncbi:P-loop containing nucleoside triphosphate hydrolase protein [Tirmania nivea]|nr:P-loop containing nucleoside triphosphate hydrolase protein [Tirmania nivea]